MNGYRSGYTIGVDGGGSTLRVALVDSRLGVRAQAVRGTANPSSIGRAAAAALIQDALREVLTQADLPVHAVGIGIAGASAAHSAGWLRETVGVTLPGVPVAASSDDEIALVGALGERRGVLILAGTGSVVFGVNAAGTALRLGGWGYLLGDEGGGAWLGLQALRLVAHHADENTPAQSALAAGLLDALHVQTPRDVIGWLYRTPVPVGELAALAPLVLEAAAGGAPDALHIVHGGAATLAELANTLIRRLGLERPPLAFAGGLLTTENALSRQLCAYLGLAHLPQPRYAPVVGAALLARLTFNLTE